MYTYLCVCVYAGIQFSCWAATQEHPYCGRNPDCHPYNLSGSICGSHSLHFSSTFRLHLLLYLRPYHLTLVNHVVWFCCCFFFLCHYYWLLFSLFLLFIIFYLVMWLLLVRMINHATTPTATWSFMWSSHLITWSSLLVNGIWNVIYIYHIFWSFAIRCFTHQHYFQPQKWSLLICEL